jgi:thiaminase
MDPTSFRAAMWAAMQGTFTRILAHPFVVGLTDGSLPRAAFAHYVVQDAHYLVAVLPCYWIYAEVGAALLARSSPEPLFARWIGTYGGEEFGKIVAEVLALVDRVGETASGPEQAAMRERVVTTARYEWMFWDAAWRREVWPV